MSEKKTYPISLIPCSRRFAIGVEFVKTLCYIPKAGAEDYVYSSAADYVGEKGILDVTIVSCGTDCKSAPAWGANLQTVYNSVKLKFYQGLLKQTFKSF